MNDQCEDCTWRYSVFGKKKQTNSVEEVWDREVEARKDRVHAALQQMFPDTSPTPGLPPDELQIRTHNAWQQDPRALAELYESFPAGSLEREVIAMHIANELQMSLPDIVRSHMAILENTDGFGASFVTGAIMSRFILMSPHPTEQGRAQVPGVTRSGFNESWKAFERSGRQDPNPLAMAQMCTTIIDTTDLPDVTTTWTDMDPWNRVGWWALSHQLSNLEITPPDVFTRALINLSENAPEGEYSLVYVPTMLTRRYMSLVRAYGREQQYRAQQETFLVPQFQQTLARAWERWLKGTQRRAEQNRDIEVAVFFFFALSMAHMPAQAYEALPLTQGHYTDTLYSMYFEDPQRTWYEFAINAIGCQLGEQPIVAPHHYMYGDSAYAAPTFPDHATAVHIGMIQP